MKALILCTGLVFTLPAAAERAASIDYEFVARPAAVPAEYDGTNLRFLATDGGKHISGQAISVCAGTRYLV